jgi:hypothetical protein
MILFLISGLIIGFILGYAFASGKIIKNKVYGKRGIYFHHLNNKGKRFEVQMEVEEVESTIDKSKIKVLSIVCNKSEFNTISYKNTIKGLINNTWVLSSEIEWLNGKSEERNNKIDKILN